MLSRTAHTSFGFLETILHKVIYNNYTIAILFDAHRIIYQCQTKNEIKEMLKT